MMYLLIGIQKKFSDLYIDPRKLELLNNYFSKQRTIVNREVNDRYKK